MSTYNRGESGQIVYVDMGRDLSTATNLTVNLQPRAGDTKIFTTNLAVGTSNITVDDQDLLANEYLEYTLQEGDIDNQQNLGYTQTVVGQWRAQGEATISGVLWKSDYKNFTVLP